MFNVREIVPGQEVLLSILVTIAAVYDIRFRRIPNWLSLSGLLLAFVLNTFLYGLAGLGDSALGMGLGFILYFPLYLLRARGAGDVKLLAAVGAAVGPGNCFVIFILAAVLGGILALIILLIKGRLQKTLWNVFWIIRELTAFRAPYAASEELDVNSPKSVRLPHGMVVALGCFIFMVIASKGYPR